VRDEGGDPAAMVAGASFEIEVAGRRIAARASLSPLYDPRSLRVRA
jgi:4-methylaminobutanoate oxidase (formaldehyde-forming)